MKEPRYVSQREGDGALAFSSSSSQKLCSDCLSLNYPLVLVRFGGIFSEQEEQEKAFAFIAIGVLNINRHHSYDIDRAGSQHG